MFVGELNAFYESGIPGSLREVLLRYFVIITDDTADFFI